MVEETVLSREITAGQLLLGRIFPRGEAYCLSGMATLMESDAAEQIKRFIQEGKLQPAEILPELDGVSLENLFGRSLTVIDEMAPQQQRGRLRCYVEEVCPGRIGFEQLCLRIDRSGDPVKLISELCQRLEIYSQHEMDVIVAYVMAVWFRSHES